MKNLFSKRHKVSFDVKSIYEGHYKTTYKGVAALKCPFDYVIYQMLIWDLKPDLLIEIGTNKGGTALYFSDLMDLIGKGEVHTIDIIKDQADPLLNEYPRIKQFTDGYHGYDLRLTKGAERILVIEDGSHTYEDTLAAMNMFAPVVTPGSYMIVEDGIIDELKFKEAYQGGPLKAIDEFLPRHPEYVIDRYWCDMFGTNATFNVDGFLKKIK